MSIYTNCPIVLVSLDLSVYITACVTSQPGTNYLSIAMPVKPTGSNAQKLTKSDCLADIKQWLAQEFLEWNGLYHLWSDCYVWLWHTDFKVQTKCKNLEVAFVSHINMINKLYNHVFWPKENPFLNVSALLLLAQDSMTVMNQCCQVVMIRDTLMTCLGKWYQPCFKSY